MKARTLLLDVWRVRESRICVCVCVCVYLANNCSEKRYRELIQKTSLGPQNLFFVAIWELEGYLHIFS